ncbi:MAG: S-layer homology domain-containing protein, partial [Clostridia bacterium]|nr:S-layer homology domain-containing protein [Clostridia bacterium]
MSGERVGGKHYFHPERALSRGAFVAILLEAAEIKAPDAEDTGFTDNEDIPRGMRGAVKYAKEQGWLGKDTVFRPHDAITRAEAAAIAARVLGLSAPGYGDAVKDHAGIPVDVVDALYSAYEGGYLTTSADGTLSHAAALTRADAALFFARVIEKK